MTEIMHQAHIIIKITGKHPTKTRGEILDDLEKYVQIENSSSTRMNDTVIESARLPSSLEPESIRRHLAPLSDMMEEMADNLCSAEEWIDEAREWVDGLRKLQDKLEGIR